MCAVFVRPCSYCKRERCSKENDVLTIVVCRVRQSATVGGATCCAYRANGTELLRRGFCRNKSRAHVFASVPSNRVRYHRVPVVSDKKLSFGHRLCLQKDVFFSE